MARYAANTSVPPERSRAEIERTLQRYGCDGFMYGWEGEQAIIAFKAHGKTIRFLLPFPHPDDEEFQTTETGRARSESSSYAEYEKALRQRWRALALAIKAKLEAVESGIVSFEDEFLAHFVLPDGSTVGQVILPDLDRALERGLPPLLPSGD